MSERDPLEGLPPDLAAVLRDQSVIVPQDARVFELIAEWAKAPSDTASSDLSRWDHAAWLQKRLGEARQEITALWDAATRVVLCADEERRIRHFTIPQLREEFGDDWPADSGSVVGNLDNAVQILRELLGSTQREESDA